MKFYTKAGRLTPYALSCGEIELHEHNGIRTTLWASHGAYHVRQHDFNERGRITWESFRTLTAARKRYDELVKNSKKTNNV